MSSTSRCASASRPERLADHQRAVLPWHAVVHEVAGLRDRRRDLRERVVDLLRHARRHADDHIGLQLGDGLVRVGVGLDHRRRGVTQLVLRPGPDAVRLVAVPVEHGQRRHAEREERILIGVADRHDPLRLGGDDRRAVLVLDRHREGGLAARARRGRRRRLCRVESRVECRVESRAESSQESSQVPACRASLDAVGATDAIAGVDAVDAADPLESLPQPAAETTPAATATIASNLFIVLSLRRLCIR